MDLFREVNNFQKSFFRIPKFAIDFLFEWTGVDATITNKSRVITSFNMITMAIGLFGGLKYSYEELSKDLGLTLRALCPCITIMVSFVKLLYLLKYRKDFCELLESLRFYLEEDVKNTGKSRIIAKFSRTSLKYTVTLFVLGFSTNVFFGLSPIVAYMGNVYFNNDNTRKSSDLEISILNVTKYSMDMPFPMSLPYLNWDTTNSTTLKTIIYVIPVIAGNSTIFGFTAVDGGFMCFCLYLSGEQQSVQKDFRKAFAKFNVEFLSNTQNDDLYAELTKLLHRNANLKKIANKLSQFYAPLILIHFLFAAVSIGIASMLLIALAKGFEKNIYIGYALSVSTQLYIYCSGAEHINENSLKFAETCYACPWYKCNKRVRKLVLLTMIDAQQGCQINVPFFRPSLQVFQAIIRTAGSYITLLQTFL